MKGNFWFSYFIPDNKACIFCHTVERKIFHLIISVWRIHCNICEVIHFLHPTKERILVFLYKFILFLKNVSQCWAQNKVWHGTKMAVAWRVITWGIMQVNALNLHLHSCRNYPSTSCILPLSWILGRLSVLVKSLLPNHMMYFCYHTALHTDGRNKGSLGTADL